MTTTTSVPAGAETAAWGTGEPISGTPFRQLVSGAATAERLVLLAVDMPIGEHVPEHVHEKEDQITIVIRGTVGATIGDRQVLMEEGSAFFLPRGIPHSQWNAGAEVARVMEIYTPSGIERTFELAGRTGAG